MNIQLTDTKQYYLSSNSQSANKHNGTFNSDITFSLPKFIQRADNILYNTIKVVHCEFPYSFYTVNIYNNTFKMNTIVVTIPVGNYTAYTLLNILNNLLQDIDPTFLLELNQTDGKYTLSCDNIFTLDTTTSDFSTIIGLQSAIYSGLFDGTKFIQPFPHPVNLMGPRNIYIKATNLILDNLNTVTYDKATLKSIPINVPPFGIIMYNNNEQTESLLKNPDTDYIQIQLTDDDNNLINFNNLNWSICVEIKSVINTVKSNQNISDYLNSIENVEE